MRNTKIVATLGPATELADTIERLLAAGVDVFRLNFSHGDHDHHRSLIARIRAASAAMGKPAAILQDISGPKIRVEAMEPLQLAPGDLLHIHKSPSPGEPCADGCIRINHPEVLETLRPGEQIYFADGTIRTVVESASEGMVTARVLVGGRLTSKKGVNLPVAGLRIPTITPKDETDLRFGVANSIDLVALSFVRSAEDIRAAKQFLAAAGGDQPVFAKIEKTEAVDNIDAIVAEADGIMIARGDLGVELGVHRVPVLQKRIIAKARAKGIPVIIATQMLTSMITSPYPTRAEVSDIANAVLDGADAVMLSDETTVGEFPREAVQVLVDTITETETFYPWYSELQEAPDSRRAMAAAAVTLARRTGVPAIVAFTESGLSALMVARQRPDTRIIACTSNPRTQRRLTVVWGVEPFLATRSHLNSDEAIYHFHRDAIAQGLLAEGQPFICTIGRHSNTTGSTNVIQLVDRHCIEQLQSFFGGRARLADDA
ncbi:MAG: pyruvate kinase [Thermodesulfobacteriota bacterium]